MKYLSTFSGIGGFELGIQLAYDLDNRRTTETPTLEERWDKPLSNNSDGDGRWSNPTCIGFSEIDKYAATIYQKHFPTHHNYGDITKIVAEELPDFDLLVGGFPCQAFSIAGKRGGFEDTRGTMFFELARILRAKQPRLFVFENVKGLLSHDGGKSFATIIQTLDELGYDCQWQVLNSKNHGVPQNRERVFIVGNRRGTRRPDVFPMNNVVQCENDKTTINEKVYALSEELAPYARELLVGMAQSQREKLSVSEMQSLFKEVKQGLQQSQCNEVEREPQEVRQESERNIQEVETLDSFLASANHTKDFRGVVQIPTEDMLLLWTKGGGITQRIGQLQQQDESADDRQTRLNEALRRWELSSLLFAVQPYQGQLFYSIGDGTDWVNVYKTKVETTCKTNDLSSILEEHPDPKYFLSEKMVTKLMSLVNDGVAGAKLHKQ
jgi:DNA-cytosine methyltransferase